jgi:DNA-binding transcriptional MerR regulator
MRIGHVAKRTGLTPDAIRFYERKSLLPRPPRSTGGFREYGETDIETLTFIRRIQTLGFKLTEVRNLLDLRQTRRQPCAPVQRRLEGKLADVRQKISQLRTLERELRVALHRCDNELRKRSPHCPILARGNPRKTK